MIDSSSSFRELDRDGRGEEAPVVIFIRRYFLAFLQTWMFPSLE